MENMASFAHFQLCLPLLLPFSLYTLHIDARSLLPPQNNPSCRDMRDMNLFRSNWKPVPDGQGSLFYSFEVRQIKLPKGGPLKYHFYGIIVLLRNDHEEPMVCKRGRFANGRRNLSRNLIPREENSFSIFSSLP